MFKPRYRISPRLLENIKKITGLITLLNSRTVPNVVKMAMEKEARELSAHSSTSIEGNPLPLTEVKRILKHAPENIRDTEREVINYNRALEGLDRKLKTGKIVMSVKAVLEIQKEITKGLIDKHNCGRLRSGHVFVNDPRTGRTVFWPPDPKDAALLLEELVDFIRKEHGKTDPLVLAGLFHKQFVMIHPFMDGNGRTARLATKALLASMGLDTFSLFSFENYYNRNVGRYFEKVGEKGNYYDIKGRTDFTLWLEYFTDGIIDELLRVGKEMEAVAVSPDTELRPQEKLLVGRIKKGGYITDRTYSGLVKRAKATRNKDFNRLIDMGIIEKKGKGKATYYKLKGK
ncbi:MAG: Fic family protein [Candidatus Margulisiibacteriota bacterium]